ncbi:hypothetical protein NMY22_g462 [Coprinellus aureogranulatus]|nr:hypothetical protein NMY22_g462 [Coprinellus aureogranulatus]
MPSAGSSKPKYRPLTGVYSDELNSIWAKDLRIPSIASRKAWAVARGLNPTSVHNWWYRRRPKAKKLRIRIPSGTYELEVGRVPTPPPTPPPKVKEEMKEVTICADPATQVGPSNNVKNKAPDESEIPRQQDVCVSQEPNALRLWTEEDELDDLRPSMRPSSPISSSSFLPSSDFDDFFGHASSSYTPPSSPGVYPRDVCGARDTLQAQDSSPMDMDNDQELVIDIEGDGTPFPLNAIMEEALLDSAIISSKRDSPGCDTTETSILETSVSIPAAENTDATADAGDTSNVAMDACTSESTTLKLHDILVTEECEKIEFESLGSGLLDGITFLTDVDWSLSAIPFLDRSKDWLPLGSNCTGASDMSVASDCFVNSSYCSSRCLLPLSLPSPAADTSSTLLMTESFSCAGSLDVCSIAPLPTMCIFGSAFAYDGSFTGRCTCMATELPSTGSTSDLVSAGDT